MSNFRIYDKNDRKSIQNDECNRTMNNISFQKEKY